MLEGFAITIGVLIAAVLSYLFAQAARSHGAPWKDVAVYALVAIIIGAIVGAVVYGVGLMLTFMSGVSHG